MANIILPSEVNSGIMLRYIDNGDGTYSEKVIAGSPSITDIITATLTRPADTNAYSIGDEVTNTGGAIRTLTDIALATGGTGFIHGVSCAISSNWAVKPQFRLWFYHTTSTPAADNAPFAPSDAVQLTALFYIPLDDTAIAEATANTGNFSMDTGPIVYPYKTVGSANLFLRVQILNAGQAGANSDTLTFGVRVSKDV